jgi:hypothetical protein
MTFLLSEDKALRQRLQGITVTDQKADADETTRKVGVWFGQPDQEIRDQAYPYITIDMIDISRALEREHRGITDASYLRPSDLPEDQGFEIDYPIPVNIDYQITTFARHPRHDREMLATLLDGRLALRFGIIELEDNTVRRFDVLGLSKRDLVEQGRRLFMNAITVRISSEIAQGTLKTLEKVQSIEFDSAETAGFSGIPPFSIS